MSNEISDTVFTIRKIWLNQSVVSDQSIRLFYYIKLFQERESGERTNLSNSFELTRGPKSLLLEMRIEKKIKKK